VLTNWPKRRESSHRQPLAIRSLAKRRTDCQRNEPRQKRNNAPAGTEEIIRVIDNETNPRSSSNCIDCCENRSREMDEEK
jgi:hypothetical protein